MLSSDSGYSKIKMIVKICHLVGAGLLLLLGISELTKVTGFNSDLFLNIYFILFGAIIALVEFNIEFIFTCVYFMKFSFGKSLFAGFIAILSYGSTYWIRLLTAIFFTVACIGFLILGIFYSKKEMEGEEAEKAGTGEKKPEEKQAESKKEDDRLPAPQV